MSDALLDGDGVQCHLAPIQAKGSYGGMVLRVPLPPKLQDGPLGLPGRLTARRSEVGIQFGLRIGTPPLPITHSTRPFPFPFQFGT